MKKLILSLILFASANSFAEIAKIPTQLTNQLQKLYPEAKVVASTACKLGDKKTDSFGLVLEWKNDTQPLTAVIAQDDQKQWQVTELPKNIRYSRGSMGNFLSDFWTKAEGLKSTFEIRCTTPDKDKD